MAKARILAVVIIGVMLLAGLAPGVVSAASPLPNTPDNLAPGNNTDNIVLIPKLKCSYSHPDNVTQFAAWWQISTDNVFSNLVWDTGITTAYRTELSVPRGYLQPSTETENMTYYWRVKVQDELGYWSGWSTATHFTTVKSFRPDQPENISPADGASQISPSHTFIASEYYDADGDRFFAMQAQIRTEGIGWDKPLWDSGPLKSQTWSYPVGTLKYSTKYYWRVRYQDDTGLWSDWSSETSFTVMANSSPNQPENVGPANGATGVTLTPALRASDFSDPNSSAYVALADTHATSEWQLSTKSGADFVANIKYTENTTTSLTVANVPIHLSAGTTYYWRVRYQDNHGNWSAWSAETSFTTKELTEPEAGFSADKTTGVIAGEEAIVFTDGSTPADELTIWVWDFGDGTTENWTTRNRPADGQIRHVYADGGTYTVKLTVVNGVKSNVKEIADYVVIQAKPKAVIREAAIGASNTVKASAQMTFTDSSTGDITSWVWDFGDGTSLEEWTRDTRPADGKIKHVYSKGGSYLVSLTASGPAGTSIKNWKVDVTGGEGFHFSLWMIGVVVAAVVVVAGVIYLIQSRKAAK